MNGAYRGNGRHAAEDDGGVEQMWAMGVGTGQMFRRDVGLTMKAARQTYDRVQEIEARIMRQVFWFRWFALLMVGLMVGFAIYAGLIG